MKKLSSPSMKPRNQLVPLALFRRSGVHGKTAKAQRLAERRALKSSLGREVS